MSGFDERERAIEAQFAHEQDLSFAIAARGNRLLARWAAKRLRLRTHEAAAYETALIRIALENGGEQAVIDKVTNDLGAAGFLITIADVGRMMAQTMADARAETVANGIIPGPAPASTRH